jgi:hypothetical protein
MLKFLVFIASSLYVNISHTIPSKQHSSFVLTREIDIKKSQNYEKDSFFKICWPKLSRNLLCTTLQAQIEIVVIIQGHYFMWLVSVITSCRLACRMDRSRWQVQQHAFYDIDGKFENVLLTKIMTSYFYDFWVRMMVSLNISVMMEPYITSESNWER